MKRALTSVAIFYAVIWAACTLAAVIYGGLGVFSAGLSVATVLAVPMCVSVLALCAAFLMR